MTVNTYFQGYRYPYHDRALLHYRVTINSYHTVKCPVLRDLNAPTSNWLGSGDLTHVSFVKAVLSALNSDVSVSMCVVYCKAWHVHPRISGIASVDVVGNRWQRLANTYIGTKHLYLKAKYGS